MYVYFLTANVFEALKRTKRRNKFDSIALFTIQKNYHLPRPFFNIIIIEK
jgi:hypothetical protein